MFKPKKIRNKYKFYTKFYFNTNYLNFPFTLMKKIPDMQQSILTDRFRTLDAESRTPGPNQKQVIILR